MQNQNSKNEKSNNSVVDLSRFSIREKKEVVSETKHFAIKSFKKSWHRMGKKNQIFATIIVSAFILIIILLVSLLDRTGGSEIPAIPPSEYLPPPEEEQMFPVP